MNRKILLIITMIFIILIINTNLAIIKFYKNENSTGLVYESSSTLKCNNFPVKYSYNVRSIQTDTCILIYIDSNCISIWSIKILHKSSYPQFWPVGSFQFCNDHEGGLQLNIDITTYFEKSSQKPKILESYKDVCSCIKIPDHIQEMEKWSINNHGNDFWAYFDPDCLDSSNVRYIRAGSSLDSDMHRHLLKLGQHVHKLKSIGPVINSTYYKASCYPYSKLMRIELLETSQSSELFSTKYKEPFSFFAGTNFRDFIFESRAVKRCQNLPGPSSSRWVTDVFGSIIADSCVLIYSHYNCTGRSIKLQPGRVANLTRQWESTITGPNTLSLIYATLKNWTWTTKSFHACHDEEGGSFLHVDITEYNLNISTQSIILEKYKNVQSCHNIPEYIRSMGKWSINNHGNSMIAYFEPDCSTDSFEPLLVPAGISSFSIGLSSFKKLDEKTGVIYRIQSFSHDSNGEYSQETCDTAKYFIPKANYFRHLDYK